MNNLLNKPNLPTGAKNLTILGISVVLIGILTTSLSLFIYHDSGDIYLDRSRPGFLPEEPETNSSTPSTDYFFPDTGKITSADLDEYVKNLELELKRLENFSNDPFSLDSLSDQSLRIPD